MGKLSAALAWAGRGFRVFPLQANSKLPLDLAWTEFATTNAKTIAGWWLDPVTGFERDYNIGFLTTDWIVADVDVKHAKRGLQTFAELGLEFDTLTIKTPSGGFHLVYRGTGSPVGQQPLGPGIDVRATNGYVVAAGSVLEGRAYEVIFDEPVAEFPSHLRPLLRAPAQRKDRTAAPDVELDIPANIERAIEWLERGAAPAIEGANGDATAYKTACRVREFGVSEAMALTLMAEHWNERCAPPWSLEEIKRKVENAYTYATEPVGSATPQAGFSGIAKIEGLAKATLDGVTPFQFGNMMKPECIPPRAWVLGNLLLRSTVTTLVAGPGGGKTICKLTLAAHLATGREFLGHKCHAPGKSIVYDAEDDVQELSRRLNAICEAYALDSEEVRKNVALVSSRELEFQLTTGGQHPMINSEHVNKLIQAARDPGVVMVAIGPLVELHAQNENDVAAMRYVMGVLRSVARDASVAVIVDHHTAKPSVADSGAWAGSQFAGRGSTAVPGAARRVITLFGASKDDCVDLGVPSGERERYVRVDDGKSSYDKRGPTQWLVWKTIKVHEDHVGVLAPYAAEDARLGSVTRVARLIGGVILMKGGASLSVSDTLAALHRDPFFANDGKTESRSKLERMFQAPVRFDDRTMTLDTSEKPAMFRLS